MPLLVRDWFKKKNLWPFKWRAKRPHSFASWDRNSWGSAKADSCFVFPVLYRTENTDYRGKAINLTELFGNIHWESAENITACNLPLS